MSLSWFLRRSQLFLLKYVKQILTVCILQVVILENLRYCKPTSSAENDGLCEVRLKMILVVLLLWDICAKPYNLFGVHDFDN